MKILIENGADINALGYQNNTPLHEAALNKRFESVKYLLECGANQNIRNEFGVLAKDFVPNMPDFIQLFNNNANSSVNSECFKDCTNIINTVSQSSRNILNGNEEFSISSSFMQRKVKTKAQKKLFYLELV